MSTGYICPCCGSSLPTTLAPVSCYQCGGCGDNDCAPGVCGRCNGAGIEPVAVPYPVAWRLFDGEGEYQYYEDEPSHESVNHAARYGRKYEPLYPASPTTPVPENLRLDLTRATEVMILAALKLWKASGERNHPVWDVWDAMLDAAPLASTLPMADKSK